MRRSRLQLVCPGLGTVLILLADTARTFKDTIAKDRRPTLTGYHITTLGSNNATDGRMIGSFLESTAGPGKAR